MRKPSSTIAGHNLALPPRRLVKTTRRVRGLAQRLGDPVGTPCL